MDSINIAVSFATALDQTYACLWDPLEISSRSWILQTIQATISELDSMTDISTVSPECVGVLECRIELVYRDFIAKEVCGELNDGQREAMSLITKMYAKLREFVENTEVLSSQPVQLLDDSVRRPRYQISYRQLEMLISMHLSVPQIACFIGVSISIIRRCMADCSLSIHNTYSVIIDPDLDAAVLNI